MKSRRKFLGLFAVGAVGLAEAATYQFRMPSKGLVPSSGAGDGGPVGPHYVFTLTIPFDEMPLGASIVLDAPSKTLAVLDKDGVPLYSYAPVGAPVAMNEGYSPIPATEWTLKDEVVAALDNFSLVPKAHADAWAPQAVVTNGQSMATVQMPSTGAHCVGAQEGPILSLVLGGLRLATSVIQQAGKRAHQIEVHYDAATGTPPAPPAAPPSMPKTTGVLGIRG